MTVLDSRGRPIRLDWLAPRLPTKRDGRPGTRARRLADSGTQPVLALEGYAVSQHSHDKEIERHERQQARRAQKNPTRADVVDPELKPSEAAVGESFDEAGRSSETEAPPTSGGRGDGGERPASQYGEAAE